MSMYSNMKRNSQANAQEARNGPIVGSNKTIKYSNYMNSDLIERLSRIPADIEIPNLL